ncbi:hypothetical protein ACFX2I_008446 [Malus domestica]|uniref:WUSCHEL-related homeobox 11-like isoform X2 n=1 Tax=Malus domestica TaxID=3750 RepID=UPI0007ECD504|nr:WUSCHEL-related homeobox 11-like [Malus domestica]WBV74689.1 Wuschel-related homebox 11 [Malus domestica]
MEDHHQGQDPNDSSPSNGSTKRSPEPVRSRWIPKPQQILILESIFNSGMVNPPKEETVRIRKLLEKFGSVGDANVFYWFQNRRSRSRRRQRQLQASLEQRTNYNINNNQMASLSQHQVGGAIQYGVSCCVPTAAPPLAFGASPNNFLVGSSSSSCGQHLIADHDVHHSIDCVGDQFFSVSDQMGFPEIEQSSGVTSVLGGGPSDTSNLHFQSGLITVFINGIPTEVPNGPLDMKAVFGQDVLLVHSSGLPLPINEFGFLAHSLESGESYFLVSRPT